MIPHPRKPETTNQDDPSADIGRLVQEAGDSTVMIAGSLVLQALQDTRTNIVRLEDAQPGSLDSRAGLAIVAIDGVSSSDLGQLGSLRDLYAEAIYVFAPAALNSQILALGFRRVKTYVNACDALTLFYYDIFDYKQTPDWLNARYWAHPERWDHWSVENNA